MFPLNELDRAIRSRLSSRANRRAIGGAGVLARFMIASAGEDARTPRIRASKVLIREAFRNAGTIAVLLLLFLPRLSFAAMKEGDVLPALDSFKLEGKLPENLKGRVILLDFWASWCGPCKSSFPAMQDLHKAYADRGLTIVAVSVDDKREDMERFLKRANVSFTTVRDAGHKLVAAADVSAMPTSFLIDRSSKIRFVHNGFRGDETVKQYREQIELLLKEPAP